MILFLNYWLRVLQIFLQCIKNYHSYVINFDSHTLKSGDSLSIFQMRKPSLKKIQICFNSASKSQGGTCKIDSRVCVYLYLILISLFLVSLVNK